MNTIAINELEIAELEPATLAQVNGGECPVFQDFLRNLRDFFSFD